MESIAMVGNKKGCLLIQFPTSIHIDKLDKLQLLLSNIEWHNQQQWQVAVEFRHASWYENETAEILKEYKAVTVLQDKPAAATPVDIPQGKTIYIRLHGPNGNYKGSYDETILGDYATKINKWQQKGKTVYCYFNNTMGNALQNLQLLNSLLENKV